MKSLLILQRIMREQFIIHPPVHQKENDQEDEKKKGDFFEEPLHLPLFLKLKIEKDMILILSEKNEKQNHGKIERPPYPNEPL
jgi:hypothetical protein